MPLQIVCSTCGHKDTVPDSLVGTEVHCPKCHTLLVPLTPDKLENFAAKVLFAAPATIQSEEVIREDVNGPEIDFVCPFCGDAYRVSAELAGKKITCRSCREPCKVDAPQQKKRRKAKPRFPWKHFWLLVFIAVFAFVLGFLFGRISKS